MKLARFPIMAACVALAVAVPHAEAKAPKSKPKPVPAPACHLLTDPAGDANGVNPGAPVPATHAGASDDAVDILSVDLGAGRSTMAWILQVKKLALESQSAPTGMFWSVHFTIRKTTFTVTAHSGPAGVRADLTYANPTGSGEVVGGTFAMATDPKKNQIRFTLPAATLAKEEASPMSAKITAIGAASGQDFGTPDLIGYAGRTSTANSADWTTTDGSYTPGKSARCATSS